MITSRLIMFIMGAATVAIIATMAASCGSSESNISTPGAATTAAANTKTVTTAANITTEDVSVSASRVLQRTWRPAPLRAQLTPPLQVAPRAPPKVLP